LAAVAVRGDTYFAGFLLAAHSVVCRLSCLMWSRLTVANNRSHTSNPCNRKSTLLAKCTNAGTSARASRSSPTTSEEDLGRFTTPRERSEWGRQAWNTPLLAQSQLN
jgi:hypothetical protein